jgi:hypothetical protein
MAGSRLNLSGAGLFAPGFLTTAGLQGRAGLSWSMDERLDFVPEIGLNSAITTPFTLGYSVLDVGFTKALFRQVLSNEDLGAFYITPRVSAGVGVFPDWGLDPRYRDMGPSVGFTDVFGAQITGGMVWGDLDLSHFVEAGAYLATNDLVASRYRDRDMNRPGSVALSVTYGARWGIE